MENLAEPQQNQRPELIFALAGPLGTRLPDLVSELSGHLRSFGYEPSHIRVSELLANFQDWKEQAGTSDDARIRHFQGMANAIRSRLKDGAVLARAAIVEIRKIRTQLTGNPDLAPSNRAYILDQLKHPEEAQLLRDVYGDAFYLIGGHASRGVREEKIARVIATSRAQPNEWETFRGDAIELVRTDDRGKDAMAQNMRDLYPLADVFLNMNASSGADKLGRFIDLLFGHPFHTPTPEEYSMYMASAAALRSSDTNRQVGAAIVKIAPSATGGVGSADVLAVGMNEVPRAGGGFYWDQGSPDHRDQNLPEDRAREIKVGILAELAEKLDGDGVQLGNKEPSELARQWVDRLSGTQFMNISEFSRPVHAEMAAIIDAARRGVSVDKGSIFVTTFPCHNCAKHIVAAGIDRVIYLEPYPKSRAGDLYREELTLDSPDHKTQTGTVTFCAYSGVAPRQYQTLFSMDRRGAKRGLELAVWRQQRRSLWPAYVQNHLQHGYVKAERDALRKLGTAGYQWDAAAICPT